MSVADTSSIWIIGQQAFDNLGQGVACGDLDGDGFDDLVLGAVSADSVGDSRDQAGQIHIILGGPSLPSLIDLQTDPGIVIYGAEPGDVLGDVVAVGDVNGDGLQDVLAGAKRAKNKAGTATFAGRCYVVFGRTTWPASIDLLTQAEVVIYGASASDFFGDYLTSGDLDGDGIDEFLATAIFGDGPGGVRPSAGDLHVFSGKASWPAEIDLAVQSSDMHVFGADEGDRVGGAGGIAVGDLDGDGSVDLITGSFPADGWMNAADFTGEVRTFEPAVPFPAVVDLRTDTESAVYGADAVDDYGGWVRVGDVNGDGRDDLVGAADMGDGPQESRPNAGEVTVVFGRNPFPVDTRLDLGEEDVIVYGPQASDRFNSKATADLNGDGVDEIVGDSAINHSSRVPSIWLISPVDTDGDGRSNLPDNCPLVFNPSQADADLDLVGDACQGDWDGDGQADADDCAPADAQAGTPAEATGLLLSGPATTVLSWQPVTFADEYDVSRGWIADLDGGDYGSCQNARDPDLTDTAFTEDQVPPPGAGYFFLIRGRNLACPAAGPYGGDSSGTDRVNTNPASCP